MVFVVNMDLAMGVGKVSGRRPGVGPVPPGRRPGAGVTPCVLQVAAQVGHAAVGLYQTLQEKNSWREMAWKWDHSG